jgi:hypothetical protein
MKWQDIIKFTVPILPFSFLPSIARYQPAPPWPLIFSCPMTDGVILTIPGVFIQTLHCLAATLRGYTRKSWIWLDFHEQYFGPCTCFGGTLRSRDSIDAARTIEMSPIHLSFGTSPTYSIYSSHSFHWDISYWYSIEFLGCSCGVWLIFRKLIVLGILHVNAEPCSSVVFLYL